MFFFLSLKSSVESETDTIRRDHDHYFPFAHHLIEKRLRFFIFIIRLKFFRQTF